MKKNWKKALAVGAAALVLSTGYNVVNVQPAEAKVNFDLFDFEAHRGGRDARPENTLVSFAYAMELGVTTLEMDMQMTKDGQLVISHNPVLSPNLTKGPDGKYVAADKYDIRTMTLAEIKQFDVGTMNPAAGGYYDGHGKTQVSVPGTKIPTLEEVFELANAYGNDKIIVILTQPEGYRKKPVSRLNRLRIKRAFPDYPELRQTLYNRYKEYNKELRKVEALEKAGKIFVFRPSLAINGYNTHYDYLRKSYDMGVADAKKHYDALVEYLEA